MNKDKSPKKGTKIEEEPTEQTEVEDVKYPQLNSNQNPPPTISLIPHSSLCY